MPQRSSSDSEVCTSKKAAEILGVTVRTVQLWTDSGILRAWKTPGGHRRYLLSELLKLERSFSDTDLPETEASSQSNQLSILIIEDDEKLQDLYRLRLGEWEPSPKIDYASDGFEGTLKIGSSKPDVVILDLKLPNVDGFRIIEALKKTGVINEMKLIVVTGLSKEELRTKLADTDEIVLLQKPVPFDDLKHHILN
ncbi:response regulator [Pontibacterium sp.]|uniref:response regulator n=1 Tax=Pontibacterium sp. TaxID=2036026 RepID=UPI003517F3E3